MYPSYNHAASRSPSSMGFDKGQWSWPTLCSPVFAHRAMIHGSIPQVDCKSTAAKAMIRTYQTL